MKLKKLFKVFIYTFVAALLIFIIIGQDLLTLIKLVSLSIAVTLGYAIYLGKDTADIKPGDDVIVVGNLRYLIGKKGKALTRAKVNEKIKVKLYDGKEAEGIVEKTEGFLGPGIIRLIYEEELVR